MSLDWPFAPREPLVRLVVGETVETFGPSEPYRDMVEHFENAVCGDSALVHPLSASLAQARALDALFASARQDGRVIDVAS